MRKNDGARQDRRAEATIEAAGWTIIARRGGIAPRFVATKQTIEEDHSITKAFESSYTLADLAGRVERREREGARA